MICALPPKGRAQRSATVICVLRSDIFGRVALPSERARNRPRQPEVGNADRLSVAHELV